MKRNILFVCAGNICRSPAAEAIFFKIVHDRGYGEYFEIDSAGTGGWYVGEPADQRMQQHARKRNYLLTNIGRKFNPDIDFDKFDMIIGMDDEITGILRGLARENKDRKKICKMTDFRKVYDYNSVPDPFYGGEEGFELVLDLLEDACEGLFEKMVKRIN
jgi:protein-tyrosine phosphatase